MRTRTSIRTRPAWAEPPTLGGKVGKAIVLAVITVSVALPLYTVFLTSISSQEAINRTGGLVTVPQGLSLGAYREIFAGGVVARSILVSLGITTVGTLISLGLTVLAAYGLSRPGSFLHRPLLLMVLLTFLFGPGLIPSYLMVSALGLIDSYGSLILPGAVTAWNLLVLRAAFMAVPQELLDSARIDGAGELRILARIVLPLSKAVTAVIALFYAVGYWNAFFNALLYLNDNAKWPLQLVLRTYVLQGAPLPGGASTTPADIIGGGPVPTLAVKMAVVTVALLPLLVAYPFVQRHFTRGVLIGAVKG